MKLGCALGSDDTIALQAEAWLLKDADGGNVTVSVSAEMGRVPAGWEACSLVTALLLAATERGKKKKQKRGDTEMCKGWPPPTRAPFVCLASVWQITGSVSTRVDTTPSTPPPPPSASYIPV